MTDMLGSEVRSHRLLDHYRLLTCLGVGGMGEVWAARDLAAPGQRIVAVKVTKQEGAEAARVLWDEARIASLIQHPNVCSVQEMGQAEGTQYLVMEWCDGASLHDLLQKVPGQALPLPVAVRIAAQVAAGLHAAHELVDESGEALGVVHRDVSPQNVLITSHGVVLVTDFGVAKAAGQAHRATETGEVKGKLSYMAPEQVRSKGDIDRRADVFALGCLLYAVTLGQRPFQGDDALATLYKILEKEPERPSAIDAAYPLPLEDILLRALAKDPDQRFQSAEEFQIALERWLVEGGTRVTEQDVARTLMSHLGDSIRQRKALLLERDRQAEAQAQAGAAFGGGEDEPSDRESTSLSTAIVTRSTPSGQEPQSSSRPTASGRLLWGALGVSVAIAVGAVVLWKTQGAAEAGGDALASLAKPPTDDAPAPALAPVVVRVRVEPSRAEILLDGQVVGVGSYDAELAPGPEERTLEARLAEHRPVLRSMVFDRNQDVHLELVPLVPDSPAPVRTPSPPAKPKPVPGTKPVAPTSAPGVKPKKPRPIDSTNPFESSG